MHLLLSSDLSPCSFLFLFIYCHLSIHLQLLLPSYFSPSSCISLPRSSRFLISYLLTSLFTILFSHLVIYLHLYLYLLFCSYSLPSITGFWRSSTSNHPLTAIYDYLLAYCYLSSHFCCCHLSLIFIRIYIQILLISHLFTSPNPDFFYFPWHFLSIYHHLIILPFYLSITIYFYLFLTSFYLTAISLHVVISYFCPSLYYLFAFFFFFLPFIAIYSHLYLSCRLSRLPYSRSLCLAFTRHFFFRSFLVLCLFICCLF